MSAAGAPGAGAGAALGARRAGVLLHPTSLPGPDTSTGTGPDVDTRATGTVGEAARRFVDWLRAAGAGVWQVLPLTPPHADGSPYSAQSVHAGDTRLLCPADLEREGLPAPAALAGTVPDRLAGALTAFAAERAAWLEDFVLYRALKRAHAGRAWWEWPEALRDRQPEALWQARREHAGELHRERYAQFLFHRQWLALKHYANARGVRLFGDLPLFVAEDSADVWAERRYFRLAADGRPAVVAGVPPDYYSETGQRWGNPHYDWERMAADGFGWWVRRLRSQLELFDLLRVDHFRGFESFWEIPADSPTAVRGRWVRAPGEALFGALARVLGPLPLVAEDLGDITPEVLALRDRLGLPGMRVAQFAFDGDPDNPHLPANHVADCVAYTGTHDNDTTFGWYGHLDEAARERVRTALDVPESRLPRALVDATLASRAKLAILPLQDVLELDSGHRLNTPGVTEGNWRWRFAWSRIQETDTGRLRTLVEGTGRAPG